MLFDKLCRYIAYGWGSVETQQIPAILEVGRSATCRPDHEVHARGTIPDVVFIIECRFIRTDLTSGTFRVCGPGVCEGVDVEPGPGPAGRRAAGGGDRPGPDLSGQEIRVHGGSTRAAGGDRVRPGRRRDRRAHPGPVGAHRAGHSEPDPR